MGEAKTTHAEAERTLAILSPDYLDTLSAVSDWAEATGGEPEGKQRTLISVQVRESSDRLKKGLLMLIPYIDLARLDEEMARDRLLTEIRQLTSKPQTALPIPKKVERSGSSEHARFPGSFPHIWNVPFSRNPYFAGREEVLHRLAETLHTGRAAMPEQPQAISGLGGVGKTQLALEYAYRYRHDYDAVLWINAESHEALISSFAAIAQLLKLPQQHEQEQILLVWAVQDWLRTHQRWLLIFDNADDLMKVKDFLPPASAGHIILTTRASFTGRLAQQIELDTLELDQGALLLLRRSGLLPFEATLDQAAPNDRELARNISIELGGLPLALDQAGAYMEETGLGLAHYLSLYRTRRVDLLKERGRIVSEHPESVATTWSLAFEKVAQKNPAAIELLQLCAFLSPDNIPEELITAGAPNLSPTLRAIADNPIAINAAISTLLQYSLIRRDAKNNALSIHRLVQSVLRYSMDPAIVHQWAERTVRIMNRVFPSGGFETLEQCDRLLPHALLCSAWIELNHLTSIESARLLSKTGNYLIVRARYPEAEQLYQQVLVLYEHLLGSDHLNTAAALNNLALIRQELGRLEEAEPIYQRALAIYEQNLGPLHPNTATSLNNLASLYQEQGKLEEAEPLYRRVLTICEQHLGPTHPDTAAILNNLASLSQDQGRLEHAEVLYQRALAVYEQQLGPTHPDTAQSLNNLALLYKQQGKLGEAEPLYQRALTIYEQQLGPSHPDTATSLNNLALLYQKQGRLEEAEPLYHRALKSYQQILGAGHLETAVTRHNLASLLRATGRKGEALALERSRSEGSMQIDIEKRDKG